MINRVIDFSVEHKFAVMLLVAVAACAGYWSMQHMPLDAIPDLSDTQVIVYSRWDRSPDIMEDQVTYPIVTAMLGAPQVKAVRGISDFGYSYVYVDFRGRHRHLLGALAHARISLRACCRGCRRESRRNWGRMRPASAGSFNMRSWTDPANTASPNCAPTRTGICAITCKAVPGVAEVAPLGGFVRQYQVNVDPNRLRAYDIPISRVVEAVRSGNNDVGGRLVEFGGDASTWCAGAATSQSAARHREHRADRQRTASPIRVKDVGQVALGPGHPPRRCRPGRHAAKRFPESSSCARARMRCDVIDRVKAKLKRDRAGTARGRQGRARLRPLRADPRSRSTT